MVNINGLRAQKPEMPDRDDGGLGGKEFQISEVLSEEGQQRR